MKKLHIFLIVGILYLPHLQASAPQMPPAPVEVIKPQQKEIAHGTVSTGELKAIRSVEVKPEISGKVVKLNLPEGHIVDQGMVLVYLDEGVEKSTLDQMVAKYDNSLLKYNRIQKLKEKGVGAKSEHDEALSNLKFDEASVNLAKSNWEKTQIKAPFSGILGLKQVNVGQNVDPSQPLITLTDITTLTVDFSIPEKYLTQLKEGQMVEILIEAIPQRIFQGRIYAISPQVDKTTHTISARAAVSNLHQLLRPGLFAKIKVVFDKNPNALLVPEQAVFNMMNKSYLYRIVDNKAVLTEVTTGVRENGQVEILKGLGAKDMVAKSGHMKLYDGAQIVDVEQMKQQQKSSQA